MRLPFVLFILVFTICCAESPKVGGAGIVSDSSTASQYVVPPPVNEIIDRYYDAVSGEGEHDWSALRGICHPGIMFHAMGINEKGENQFYPSDLGTYIEHLTPYIRDNGFYQKEISRKTDFYNRIAQAWSVYESRNDPGGPLIERGILCFQLMLLQGKWKIVHIMWNSETEEYPVPEKFLQ